MRTFLNYLQSNRGSAFQLFIIGPNGEPTSKSGDVLEFDEFGITIAVQSNVNSRLIEAYPWSAIRGIVTTFTPDTVYN